MNGRWQTTKLGEIADVQSGGTPSVSNKDYWNGSLPWYSSGELNELYTSAPERYISKLGLDNSNAKLFPPGSLLIGMYDTAALKMSLLDRAGAFNQAIAGVRPNAEIDLVFVLHAVNAIRDSILVQRRGVRQKNLSLAKIRGIELPVPPLREQQRIAGVLGKAFESIAKARANAEKNLQNAGALFESYLQLIFSQREKRWVAKRLGDVVTRLTNGYVGPTRNIYVKSGVPYLLARHVRNNRLTFDNKTFISDAFNQKNQKSILKTGDVLLVQSGHIGHSAVVTKEHEGHNCHAMIVITPVKDVVMGPFLSVYFNSLEMREKFEQIRSGSTVPHLTCRAVKELTIALPDLSTQHLLVEQSQEMKAETQRLRSIYERKLETLERLRNSLLHQAFAGRL